MWGRCVPCPTRGANTLQSATHWHAADSAPGAELIRMRRVHRCGDTAAGRWQSRVIAARRASSRVRTATWEARGAAGVPCPTRGSNPLRPATHCHAAKRSLRLWLRRERIFPKSTLDVPDLVLRVLLQRQTPNCVCLARPELIHHAKKADDCIGR